MFVLREKRIAKRRSRFAAGAIMVATAASLAVSGCAASSSPAKEPPAAGQAVSEPSSNASGLQTWLKNSSTGDTFASPASTIAPHNPLTGPPADPFAGTPADHWGDGATGITIPAAKPVGEYTTAQVKSAYQMTRRLLAAANLDPKTLLGGSPTAFAALLTSQQRTWFLNGLDKTGTDSHGDNLNTRYITMSFAPASTELVGSVIKVHGTMTAHTSVEGGATALDVDADYIFVYPVEPPGHPTQWMRVVRQVDWTVSFGDWAGAATSFAPFISSFDEADAGGQCATTDGYDHPSYPEATADPSASPTGTPVDPYALAPSLSQGCQATTST